MRPANKDELARRIREVEVENSNLASLYVALSQLHSTLQVRDVLDVVIEILLNFVGADRFAVMIPDGQGALRPLAVHGVDRDAIPAYRAGEGARGELVMRVDPRVEPFCPARDPARDPPVVWVPLDAAGERIGALAMWGFLRQKTAFADIDFEIFQLLARSAGTALEAARLAMTSRRQPARGYYEAFTALIE
jgi:hypothetical protein